MSRTIQHRRGTTAEHENFIGAPGEITYDTDLKTLRVHDGETPGGHVVGGDAPTVTLPENMDYVVETQLPTAENNYTWYRKYASGWVEQGGQLQNLTTDQKDVKLPITMANGNYNISLGLYHSNSSVSAYPYIRTQPKTTGFGIKTSSTNTITLAYWRIEGIGA